MLILLAPPILPVLVDYHQNNFRYFLSVAFCIQLSGAAKWKNIISKDCRYAAIVFYYVTMNDNIIFASTRS